MLWWPIYLDGPPPPSLSFSAMRQAFHSRLHNCTPPIDVGASPAPPGTALDGLIWAAWRDRGDGTTMALGDIHDGAGGNAAGRGGGQGGRRSDGDLGHTQAAQAKRFFGSSGPALARHGTP